MSLPKIAVLSVLCLTCAACGRRQDTPPPSVTTNAPAEKSTMTTAIEGFTGKTAVDQLHRAKSTVRDAEAAKKKQMDEALAE